MKYRVTIESQEREIDVAIDAGRVSVTLDGKPIEADIERVPGGVLLRIAGRVYDVAIGGKPELMQVGAGSARVLAEVVSERNRSKNKRSGALGSGEREIRAPMPGRVVKVLVSAGAEVTAGQPCIVIEAMKMENELRAPVAGKIATVHVTEGVSVESQALLVSFE
jgi:biotin carboxyl carrier protein